MNSVPHRLVLVSLAGSILSVGLFAQAPKIDFPAPSPACALKQRVGLTDVTIDYSRPSARGRKMLGGQNPYGEVWRTGANASTKLSFSTAVKLNGVAVPAGTYALYTIPGEREWTVIVDKDTSLWGAYDYDQKNDLVRFQAVPSIPSEPVETFTIEFGHIRDESAMLYLIWEKFRVPIKLEVSVVPEIVAQIDAAMAAPGKKPYGPAAQFYLDHQLDLHKALGWVEAALAEKPGYSLLLLKARLLAKTGDKDGAIAAAQQSIELADKVNGPSREEYTRLNQELIDSLR